MDERLASAARRLCRATRRATRWRAASRARAVAASRATADARAFRRAGPVPATRAGAFRGKRDVRRLSRLAVWGQKAPSMKKRTKKGAFCPHLWLLGCRYPRAYGMSMGGVSLPRTPSASSPCRTSLVPSIEPWR